MFAKAGEIQRIIPPVRVHRDVWQYVKQLQQAATPPTPLYLQPPRIASIYVSDSV